MENEQKTVEQMNRPEIIFALKSYAHPDWYHAILVFPTNALRALLIFYTTAE